MQVYTIARAGFVGLSILMVSSCDDMGTVGQKSFQSQYKSARTALEKGDFSKANRNYMALMQDAGPLQPRIQLELSHSLLREGNFGEAAKQAGALANSQKGKARSAALSVLATADHEMGLAALNKGDQKMGKTYLERAEAALTEVLKENPDLDPLGGLSGRKASIKVRLGSMR